MKSKLLFTISWLGLQTLVVLSVGLATRAQASNPAHYIVTDLGTLPGGNFSQPFFINNNGVVSGSSNLPDNTQHSVLWHHKRISDLGTLGGSNSYAFGLNARGQAVGEAETSDSDPNGEDFCGFGTHLICQPFEWQNNVMTPLPTLGGNNGGANRINRRGTAVGFAENSTVDPACPAPQKLQFKPVAWNDSKAIELPIENGDPEGLALGINDHDQIVGGSGTCSTFNSIFLYNLLPVHALLWQNGKVVDLGNLGGSTGQAQGNLALAINNRGQVVGFSDLSGDTTFHGFLWTKATGMQDLGTLSGDVASAAIAINDHGVAVGASINSSFSPRAFVWKNGVMTDLNTLVQANPALYLLTGCAINSRGEITGLGATSTGEIHTYRAVPIQEVEFGVEGQQ